MTTRNWNEICLYTGLGLVEDLNDNMEVTLRQQEAVLINMDSFCILNMALKYEIKMQSPILSRHQVFVATCQKASGAFLDLRSNTFQASWALTESLSLAQGIGRPPDP